MDKSNIRTAQTKLADMGHYKGKIDGDRGPKTHAAVAAGMAGLGQGVPAGFTGWSGKRQTVAFLQAYAHSQGLDAGKIDGLWGPQTDFAVDALQEKLATGKVRHFVDEGAAPIANPHGFPKETRDQRGLIDFYGKAGTKDGSFRPPLVQVPVPWTLKISFMPRATRKALWVHEKAADSLKRVLERIDAAYDDAQKTDLGINIFGGDYAPRIMRGAGRPSLHSWGIAFDFDPDRNGLKWNSQRARLGQPDAIPFWEAWEAEGWCSLGRARNYDFMHVQASERAY